LGCIATIKGLYSQRLWQKQNIFLQIFIIYFETLETTVEKKFKKIFLKRTPEP